MKVPQAGQRVSGGKERSKKVKDGPLTEAVQSNYNNRIVELALFVFDAGISLFRSCSPPADQGDLKNFPLKSFERRRRRRRTGKLESTPTMALDRSTVACLPALAPKLPQKEHQSVPKAFTEARELSSRLAWPLFLANSLVSSTRTHHMLVSFVVLQYRISLAR